MSHPITYFTDEEKDVVLELARMALSDAEVYDRFADILDLSDECLKELQDKIESHTNGVHYPDEME